MRTVICVVLSALLGSRAGLGPRVSAARDNTLDRSGAAWCAHELRIAHTSLVSPPLSFLVCAREWTMTRSRVFLFKNHKRCVCHLVDTPRGLTVLLLYTLVTFVAVTRRCCIHLSRLTPRRDLIGIPTFLSPDSISPKLVETIFAPLAPSDNTS